MPGIPQQWPVLTVSLVLVLAGYGMVRPHLQLSPDDSPRPVDLIGATVLVAGVVVGSYADSQVSQLLAVACPVVWIATRRFRPGVIANLVMIAVTCLAIVVASFRQGTLAHSWSIIAAAGLIIAFFTIMVGSMVHAALRWGKEREELLSELQASQDDLGESYRQLMTIGEPAPSPIDSPLSSREIEVLALVSEGCTNREIGRRLFISPATVKTHMEHILTKLGATTRAQAVLLAHQDGLLPVSADRPEPGQ
ncbi:MAG: LuxR C-terminal-related transcriptional regulator [Propionibacteriaceae bacterium]|nr:LuxR C-terminal-related transcriptional regulator [Propionibacteriaceae bacterium]